MSRRLPRGLADRQPGMDFTSAWSTAASFETLTVLDIYTRESAPVVESYDVSRGSNPCLPATPSVARSYSVTHSPREICSRRNGSNLRLVFLRPPRRGGWCGAEYVSVRRKETSRFRIDVFVTADTVAF